ncbi:MAG: hypothetical protein ACD_29C00263G0001, partial [uncultured bacterium]
NFPIKINKLHLYNELRLKNYLCIAIKKFLFYDAHGLI